MTVDEDIRLGQKVQDRISGFTGIVTTVGDHITGCTRFGVHPSGEERTDQRGDEEFFYADQLEVLEEETEFTDVGENGYTDLDIELGSHVRDEVIGFEGIVCVINYKLWNCPQVMVQARNNTGTTDKDPDYVWVDIVRLERTSSPGFEDGLEDVQRSEEASDSGSVQDCRPRNDAP